MSSATRLVLVALSILVLVWALEYVVSHCPGAFRAVRTEKGGTGIVDLDARHVDGPSPPLNTDTPEVVIRTPLSDQRIVVGMVFWLQPVGQGSREAGELQLRLIAVEGEALLVEMLGDSGWEGRYIARAPVERVYISSGDCLPAMALVTDVSLRYCVTLQGLRDGLYLTYRLEEVTTMPLP